MKLTLLRKKIDQIDHNLLKLLAGRLEICKEIGRYKKKNKLLIQNLAREKEIIKERNKRFEELGFNDKKFVQELFKLIMNKSRKVQK